MQRSELGACAAAEPACGGGGGTASGGRARQGVQRRRHHLRLLEEEVQLRGVLAAHAARRRRPRGQPRALLCPWTVGTGPGSACTGVAAYCVASATHRSTVATRALRQAKECRQQAALRDKATCRVGRGQTTAKLRRTGPHVLPHRRTAAEPESRQRTVTGRSSVAGREQRLPAVQDVLGRIRGAGQRGERPLPAAQAGELCLDGLHALQDSSQALCMTLHVSMVMYIFT